jgi:hypothetical protein
MTLAQQKLIGAAFGLALAINLSLQLHAQSPYQAQDPVVTIIPSVAVGEPIPPSDDASEYKRLRCHFSIAPQPAEKYGPDCEKGATSERAHSLINQLLRQRIVTSLNPMPPDNLLDRTLTDDLLGLKPSAEEPNKAKPALLVHIAVWHVTPNQLTDGKQPRVFTLMHSEWHGFTADCKTITSNTDANCSLSESKRSDGSPSFYDTRRVYFVAINEFDSQMFGSRVSVDYKLYQLAQESANLIDLSTALSAISGVPLPTPQSSTAVLSAPLPIDTGTAYHGTDNATIMLNIYQAVLPDERQGPYAVPRTSRTPYSLNANFYLQFQPSPLSVSQGQKLAPPAASANGQPPQSSAQDTSLYLKDHLEPLYPSAVATSVCPLPPGLVFKTDIEASLLNYFPGAQLVPVDSPSHCVSIVGVSPDTLTQKINSSNSNSRKHLANLLVAAALEKSEQSLLLASEQAYTSLQLVPNLLPRARPEADAKDGLTSAAEMPLSQLLLGKIDSAGTSISGAISGAIAAELAYQYDFNVISSTANQEEANLNGAVSAANKNAASALSDLTQSRTQLKTLNTRLVADQASQAQALAALQTAQTVFQTLYTSVCPITPPASQPAAPAAIVAPALTAILPSSPTPLATADCTAFAAPLTCPEIIAVAAAPATPAGPSMTSPAAQLEHDRLATAAAYCAKSAADTAVNQDTTSLAAQNADVTAKQVDLNNKTQLVSNEMAAAGQKADEVAQYQKMQTSILLARTALSDAETASTQATAALQAAFDPASADAAKSDDPSASKTCQQQFPRNAYRQQICTSIEKIDTSAQSVQIAFSSALINEQAAATADVPATKPLTAGACCCCQPTPAPATPAPAPSSPPAGPPASGVAAATKDPGPADPVPQGGAITGIPFRAGDFPQLITIHSDPAHSCALPQPTGYGPDDNPCVQFVLLTSQVTSSASSSPRACYWVCI